MAKPRLFAVLPDQQIPYFDPHLNELVLRWLDTNRPDGLVFSGDLVDWPAISRHDWNPALDPEPHVSVQHAVQETQRYLGDVLAAAGPGCTERYLIEGNHEKRLGDYLIKHAPHLYGLTTREGQRMLGLENVLNLADYGVQLVLGGWPAGKLWLSDHLAVMHGWRANKGAGVTARNTLEHLGHSIIVGHTHRQAVIYSTKHPRHGAVTRTAVEAGTLARLEGGLGYAVDPDWQQGFCVVRVHEDGTFYVSLATYSNGLLWWEDQRYGHTRNGVQVA